MIRLLRTNWSNISFFFCTFFFHVAVDASALASVRTEITQKNELAKKYSPVISQFAEVSSRIIWYSKSPFYSKHVDVLDSGPLEEGQLDSCVNRLFSYYVYKVICPRANRIQKYIEVLRWEGHFNHNFLFIGFSREKSVPKAKTQFLFWSSTILEGTGGVSVIWKALSYQYCAAFVWSNKRRGRFVICSWLVTAALTQRSQIYSAWAMAAWKISKRKRARKLNFRLSV